MDGNAVSDFPRRRSGIAQIYVRKHHINGKNKMDIVRKETTAIFSRVVEHNGIVYLSGFTADDTSASMKTQTEDVLAKIDKYLALAGTRSRS